MIFCLAVALKAQNSAARNWLLALIAYFWYFERVLHVRRWELWPAVVLVSFVLLFALLAAAWNLQSHVRWKSGWRL